MAQNTLNTPRETTIQRIAIALENILNKIVDTSRASNIDYDNTESDLTADKVQGAIDELAEEKVDKVTGKGLSTNDYTTADKNKLAGIEAEANKTVVDSAMSDSSTNPLQNKVITAELAGTTTATGNPLTIQASESNLVECVAEVEAVQEGSGDPSPDNIRPIIGQTEVVIDDVGKNLIDVPNKTISSPGFVIPQLTSLKLKAGNYVFSHDYSGSSSSVALIFYDENSNEIARGSRTNIIAGKNTSSVVLPSNCAYYNYYSNAVGTYSDFQLELGNTATEYEPYTGKTYTIQLGDTIYGGELNVITGELTVTHGEVDLGDCNWVIQNIDGNNCFRTTLQNKDFTEDAICSQYSYSVRCSTDGTFSTGLGASTSLYVRDSRYSDTTAFKTAMSGVQLVYELAEPYTIKLTPQQIRLLKGTNNISCNTGDLSIKYYPDNVLGQLKGDIEEEYDSRIETLEEKANNALKIKSITTTTVTNQQGVSSQSYDNYVQGDKKFIPVSIIAKTTGYDAVDVHYVLDESNRLIYFIPKDLTGSAIPSGRTVSMTIRYFEI